MQACAPSQANKDEDLAGCVCFNRTALAKVDDATRVSMAAALLKKAAPQGRLAKREFTADDLAATTQQPARFVQKQTSW